MKLVIILSALISGAVSLASCAPLVIGGIAGVAVYRHECYKSVDTLPQVQTWVCKGKP
jgi:hypothetical protein